MVSDAKGSIFLSQNVHVEVKTQIYEELNLKDQGENGANPAPYLARTK
jgi:hypothetical protein